MGSPISGIVANSFIIPKTETGKSACLAASRVTQVRASSEGCQGLLYRSGSQFPRGPDFTQQLPASFFRLARAHQLVYVSAHKPERGQAEKQRGWFDFFFAEGTCTRAFPRAQRLKPHTCTPLRPPFVRLTSADAIPAFPSTSFRFHLLTELVLCTPPYTAARMPPPPVPPPSPSLPRPVVPDGRRDLFGRLRQPELPRDVSLLQHAPRPGPTTCPLRQVRAEPHEDTHLEPPPSLPSSLSPTAFRCLKRLARALFPGVYHVAHPAVHAPALPTCVSRGRGAGPRN